ncbi:hypothetical protein HETIRDRAFT_414890 [Heterobasidion irregulare TC 32-1]|uniref:Uncharacterized protein n=1 Tax=Heterobasidion irregulare (strain TC 32-1) TaxID=747525 RepID=W4KKN9_HETIT|nr:uncharacterized protein HETIRDRAFT_414890 [Heterobasidion irregulare TC 32-1]ETW85910.1 hypothetical protein HETIRDRAFT_414890 [Heterobasidion irregulare TC 32-1]
MLLHEDHDASSPSRNSSPDVVLMVSNPDIGQMDRGTSPHPSNAGRIDRGTSPHHPEPAIVTLTPHLNNFSDDDAEDYAKFKERERTRRPSSQGPPRDASRNENPDDRNPPGSDEVPMGVPPPATIAANVGAAGPSGLRARTAAQLPSHGEINSIPVIQGATPPPVPTGGQIPRSMGRTTLGTNPHARELERHADALLQRSTISAIRGLALQTDPDTASWYEHNDGRPRALLIHPDKFSQYVNRELLPALLFTGELGAVQPNRTDPFRVVVWNVPRPGERPTAVPNPRRAPRTVVERPPPRPRESRPTHSNPTMSPSHRVRNLPLSHGGTDEEEPPVYRRNEGRRSRGTQATLRRGTTTGGSVRHRPGTPPPSARFRTDEGQNNRSSRRTHRTDSEARRNRSWTRSELDAWDALDDPGNYDDADPYYRPDEGGDGYQGPYDY